MNPKMLAADAADILGVSLQAIHKQLRTKKLSTHKTQNRIYFDHTTASQIFNFQFEPKIVAMQIVKGGTGKTCLTQSIAIRANLYGAKVLCIDLDQQGNLTQAFNADCDDQPVMVDVLNDNLPIQDGIMSVMDGLDLIPSRIENAVLDNTIMLKRLPLDRVYFNRFQDLKEKYDLILIDCPPALGQSVAAATLASDVVVSPVTPEKFCLSGLKITWQEIRNLSEIYRKQIPLKILLNKFDSRTSLSHEVLSMLIKHQTFGSLLFKSYIRSSQEIPNMIARGKSVFDSIKNTAAKEDIDLLTREFLGIDVSNNRVNSDISLGSLEENVSDVA